MADLITVARAKYNLNNLATTSAEDTTLAALVAACSKAIQRFCRREFTSQTFDQVYYPAAGDKLILDEYPILSIARVATAPTTVLLITNTSATNQRATVAVTATGLTLVRTASGTTTSDTSVTWAGNATVNAVKNAVNALGNGWSAVVNGAHADWPAADLRAPQGALNAKNVYAALKVHIRELASYEIDAERGWLLRRGSEPICGSVRVVYTAGYATVPEDVQEACAEWVAALFYQTKRDPGLVQEAVVGAVARTAFPIAWELPQHLRGLLRPYRKGFLR
jgi:hypothetical protein